jgi:hypothetical protein
MIDAFVILLLIAAFAVAGAYIWACDQITSQ